MNAAYSLYLVRGGFHTDTEALYDQSWDPRSFEGEKLASSEGITGAKISLWPDNGRGETENEVAADTGAALGHIAQATWGDPASRRHVRRVHRARQAVGHAPGWRDLTRVPVADGTYTFAGHDGHVSSLARPRSSAPPTATSTLQSTADGCLEIRGGKLTLNVPLQPGVAVDRGDLRRRRTPCSAGSWRPRRAATGCQRDHADGACTSTRRRPARRSTRPDQHAACRLALEPSLTP